ncbi:MAG: site-specific DNA-methyltransferase [Nitrospirota bacterium]
MNEPEKLDLRSLDISEEKKQKLLRLFPEILTEGGKIDFERLQLALGESVDVGRERYGMNWPGKAECFKTIQTPSMATLIPAPKESINFDTTENLIIEGDNLEVLKLLQKSYLGKVKMIYIDPPYNTGNDFIYPDNYTESLQTYLEYTGQVDAEGRKFGTNTETDGRFHSKWLNMMYPRLYLARNLLKDEGVVFISIDDTEVKNLRALLDEIFGEENFVANAVWQKKYSVSNDDQGIAPMHDHILAYQRSENFERNLLPRKEKQTQRYTNPDNDPRGDWSSGEYVSGKSKQERPTLWYAINHPKTGKEVWPEENAVWRYSREKHVQLEREGRLYWGPDMSYKVPRLKRYIAEIQDGVVPSTWWPFQEVGHNDEGQKETAELLGPKVFSTPKPIRLLRRMIELGCGKNDVVMDFFAGSGATAHAVLDLNKQDGGKRKFILVQLPEPTDREDYPTIADITKERIRRVIQKLNKEEQSKLALDDKNKHDRGFKVFKLSESNFKPWNAQVEQGNAAALEKQLDLHVDHIRDGRTSDDILYELLLKSGFPLATPIKKIALAGKTIHSAADGALFICLEKELNLELIRAMAEQKPARVVCLDEGFAGNDQLKANAVQIFKTKGVTSFKTV